KSFGYAVPWRPTITATGAATAALAPFGCHSINLAAIGASFAAAPDAHPDFRRRWIASVSTGVTFVALGLVGAVVAAWFAAGPPGVMTAVAGLALLGTLGSSLSDAMSDTDLRVPVVVTLVTCASGVVLLGLSSAF